MWRGAFRFGRGWLPRWNISSRRSRLFLLDKCGGGHSGRRSEDHSPDVKLVVQDSGASFRVPLGLFGAVSKEYAPKGSKKKKEKVAGWVDSLNYRSRGIAHQLCTCPTGSRNLDGAWRFRRYRSGR
jgi:hypothetical protein